MKLTALSIDFTKKNTKRRLTFLFDDGSQLELVADQNQIKAISDAFFNDRTGIHPELDVID